MNRKLPGTALIVGAALVLLWILSLTFQLELPATSGPYAVSQTVLRWVDSARLEAMTEDPNDFREVMALLWYPAESGTGTGSSYFPELSTISKSLVESGEVASWEVFGLQFIRSRNLWNAEVADDGKPYPLVIFSPGNGTNVEFYTVLASELASHGYIVVGLNHPYDVAAVELSDHRVAQFYREQNSLEMSANEEFVAERIKVRTEDVLFALEQLEAINSNVNSPFAGRLDLTSVAVAGHSLGGVVASEACKANTTFHACLNLDGIQRGGPFSTEETATPPDQPFMFLTKESKLPPNLIEKFESMTENYWVVIHGATHDSFTDGPLLQPGLLPISNPADQIMSLIQKYTLAFLDQTLKSEESNLLSRSADLQGVRVEVYPSD